MKDALSTIVVYPLIFGWTFGPLLGAIAAMQEESVWHLIGAVCVPFYGIIYAIDIWFF